MADAENISEKARYFNNAALSDVTIHFSGRQVKAHRFVLASQSEHFRAMFEGGFAEAAARDVHLYDDDPEAMYGALAWCYGLYYDGQTTFQTMSGGPSDLKQPSSYSSKRTQTEHYSYIIDLYATGGKYMMPKVQAHAEEHFNARMNTVRPGWWKVMRGNPRFQDKWMEDYQVYATLLYQTLEDSVKELRPAFARAMWAVSPGLRENERFGQLMVDIPELALEMLELAMDAREEAEDV